jgi:hypothetical protein
VFVDWVPGASSTLVRTANGINISPQTSGLPWNGRRLRSRAMDKPRCRQPNRFKRLIAFLRRRCEQKVPNSWLDEPPADPDIGVREPRRPRPHGGAGSVLLEPPN